MREKLAEDHMHVRDEHGVVRYCGKRAGWCHQNIFPNWRVFRVVPKQPAPQEPPLPSNGFATRANHPPSCPTTLGDVWIGQSQAPPEVLAAAMRAAAVPIGLGVPCTSALCGFRCGSTGGHSIHEVVQSDGVIVRWTDRPEPLVPRKPLRCGTLVVEPTIVWVCGRLLAHEGKCSPVRETKS